MIKDICSRAEAARVLGVTPTTISNYVKKGLLTEMSGCLNGSSRISYFYNCEEVDALKAKYPESPQIIVNLDEAMLTLKKLTDDANEKIEQLRKGLLYISNDRIDREAFSDCVLSALLAIGTFKGDTVDPQYEEIISDFLHGYRLKKIAEKREITVERARQILYKALRRLTGGSVVYLAEKYNLTLSENDRLRNENIELKNALRNYLSSPQQKDGESCILDIIRSKTNDYIDSHPVLLRKLAEFQFSPRALNCLKANHISYVYELAFLSRETIMKFRCLGRKSLAEIEKFFDENDLIFEAPVSCLISPEKLAIKPYSEKGSTEK